MSDSTPTTPLPTPGSPATPPADVATRRPLIILISVAAALLLAIIILLIVLFGRGSDDPVVAPSGTTTPSLSPSPTPTETTPSPTPTVSETSAAPVDPEPDGPIESFTVDDKSVDCDGVSSVPLHFSWSATGDQLWFGVGTNNAKNAPYDTYPLVHDLDFDYQCGQASKKQTYTITVEIGNDLFSETVTIKE